MQCIGWNFDDSYPPKQKQRERLATNRRAIDRMSVPSQYFSKAMDTGKITFIDALAMQKSLNATGRINLYGIYFDTDKDTIKPESKPTIDEISKLMRDSPQLRLQVVGHTDSTGGDAHGRAKNRRVELVRL